MNPDELLNATRSAQADLQEASDKEEALKAEYTELKRLAAEYPYTVSDPTFLRMGTITYTLTHLEKRKERLQKRLQALQNR